MRQFAVLRLLTVAIVLASPVCHATVVTSGTVVCTGQAYVSGGCDVNLDADGVSYTGGHSYNFVGYGPFAPDTSFGVHRFGDGLDGYCGTIAVNGVIPPGLRTTPSRIEMWRACNFELNGPNILLDHGPGIYTGTFSMYQSVCGFYTSVRFLCAIDLYMTGSGVVELEFSNGGSYGVPARTHLSLVRATYTIVPEPSAVWYLAFVFVGLVAVRYWRFKAIGPLMALSATVAIPVCHASVVTSGSITFGLDHPEAGFVNFEGDGFSYLNGGWADGSLPAILPSCAPLFPCFSPHHFEGGSDFGYGTLTINGTTYDGVQYNNGNNAQRSSYFDLEGSPVLVDHGAGLYSGSFTFAGSLCGVISTIHHGEFLPCIADLPEISGAGIFEAQVRDTGGPGEPLSITSITYIFVRVPEPATLGLLSLSLVAFSLARKKRSC